MARRRISAGPQPRAIANDMTFSFQSEMTSAAAGRCKASSMTRPSTGRENRLIDTSPGCWRQSRVGQCLNAGEREVMVEFREDSGNSPRSLEDAGDMTAFGEVRFNIESGDLYRDGKTTRLTPKAAAALAALLEKAPGLVTKEELLSRVWGGRAVGDDHHLGVCRHGQNECHCQDRGREPRTICRRFHVHPRSSSIAPGADAAAGALLHAAD